MATDIEGTVQLVLLQLKCKDMHVMQHSLSHMNGVSHFNILSGTSNCLKLLNFHEEALQQEDVFGNPVIKDDIIVIDNCGFHHGNNVEPPLRDMLQERHVQLIYQPPYNPYYIV